MKLGLVIAGVLILLPGAWADPVDPVSPVEQEELHQDLGAVQKRWLPARIRLLEEEKRLLDEQISALPQHSPKPMPNHMGYHTLPVEQGDANGVSHV